MFDTHCHLNFSTFENNVKDVVDNAHKSGIDSIIVPGTDYETSKKAIEIAEQYEGIYAAVGIHPHHIYQYQNLNPQSQNYRSNIKDELQRIEKLLTNKKVVAVGEVGIDRHYYQKTKYPKYKIDESFINLQQEFLKKQIQMAIKYDKSLILHNREAKNDLLSLLNTEYGILNTVPIVFHCCEPDEELLDFAIKHNIFIGVDGDVTYDQKKQEFVKKIPLGLLVLETDSPFLKPAGIKFPNEPKNIKIIAEYIASLTNIPMIRIIGITTENAKRLFQLKKDE